MGAVSATWKEKNCQGLGFEYLQQQLWYRNLCWLFKTINIQSPSYILQLTASLNPSYFLPNSRKVPHLCTKHKFLKKYFAPSTINKSNKKIVLHIIESKNINIFNSNILKFVQYTQNSVYY